MRYLFVFSLSLFFTACKDSDAPPFNPLDASQLEGFWYNEPQPAMPKKWFWHFSDGLLRQETFDFGQQIVEHLWGYETRADTLFLREVLEPDAGKIFTVYFESDSAARLTDVTNELHLVYRIKRF